MTHCPSLALIGYAFGLGAEDYGCAEGPDALKRFGLERHARAAGLECQWQRILREENPQPLSAWQQLAEKTEIKIRRTVPINLALKQEVSKAIYGNKLPVVIGGDHSHAIGEVAGVKVAVGAGKRIGLVYVDAHLDGHTETSTPSGNTHGMGVAALLGYGDPRLTAIANEGATLDPKDVYIVCARDYEAEEHDLLKRLGVTMHYMSEVNARGFGTVVDEAMTALSARVDAICLQIDLDAFDPADAPATGYNIPDGLRREAALSCFEGFLTRYPAIHSFALTEYNPHKDDAEQRTAQLLGSILEGLCRSATAVSSSPAKQVLASVA